MRSYTSLAALAILAVAATFCLAQESSIVVPVPTADANSVGGQQFPYMVEITGNDVYIRSGPGTNYYQCGKCDKGDRMKVVSTSLGWSRVVPPAGNYSWISMRYLSINRKDPTQAVVTGDRVRVYAGSEDGEPLHSQIVQVRLDWGDPVTLMPGVKDEYCKIAPPTGAYMFVSSKYTKPIKTVSMLDIPPADVVDPNLITNPIPVAIDTNSPTPVAPVEAVNADDARLAKYREIEKKIVVEREKAVATQDYAEIKKGLQEILAEGKDDRAAKYSQLALDQIERFELALKVQTELGMQTEELKDILARIDSTKEQRLANIKSSGKYAVIGFFKTSNIYGPEASLKHYRVVDATGKTICYALPKAEIASQDFMQYVGKKVGLVGEISPHTETGGALVKFSAVETVEN